MNSITMRIRYKRRGEFYRVNVYLDKDRASCEDVAALLAEAVTNQYAKYLGGKKNMKELRRYKFGQYKLILPELERLVK